MAEANLRGWRLDRSIPLMLVLMVCIQLAGVVWWAAGVESRISAIEGRQARYEATADTAAQRLGAIEQRLGCVQTDVSWIKRALGAVEK
jgi:hypothetical protein